MSPVADWTPFVLGGTSSRVISLCLFILFMGFSQQEYWNGLPFPPPIDHILSEFFTMTGATWVALHRMAYSFIELCKPLHHNKVVIHEGKAMTSLDSILKSKDFTLLTKVHIVVHLSVMSEFLQPHGHARLPRHSPFPKVCSN